MADGRCPTCSRATSEARTDRTDGLRTPARVLVRYRRRPAPDRRDGPTEAGLLEQARALQERTLAVLEEAADSADAALVLRSLAESRRNLALTARMLGLVDDRPQVNILGSPEWLLIRTALLEALTPFPAARDAVLERVGRLTE